jgi:hypothetical protein
VGAGSAAPRLQIAASDVTHAKYGDFMSPAAVGYQRFEISIASIRPSGLAFAAS